MVLTSAPSKHMHYLQLQNNRLAIYQQIFGQLDFLKATISFWPPGAAKHTYFNEATFMVTHSLDNNSIMLIMF